MNLRKVVGMVPRLLEKVLCGSVGSSEIPLDPGGCNIASDLAMQQLNYTAK